jgi:hypothetical protein
MDRPKSSRRHFLKSTTKAGALLAFPTIIPARVLGRGGAVPPSEQIQLGAIGIRGRGMHDLRWIMSEKDVRMLAICDLQKVQRESVKKYVDDQYGNKDCAMFPEIREFLAERNDLDAVLIATGDRWHALASILAMRSGKDVYTEKPSCMTIAEGRAVVETADRYARVYQTGTQRLSEAHHVFGIEMARAGRLGEIHTAYAHIAPWDDAYMSNTWAPAQELPPREEVDWDAWLGPCPWRPYNHKYVRGGWRGVYDFHTSCIGEWGAHTFAQAQMGIGCSESSPVAYEFVDNKTGDEMVCHFANGVKMILSRGNKYWHGSCGERFDGTEGWVAAADRYTRPEVSNPAILGEFKRVVDEYSLRTGRPFNHMRNFLDCVRSRQQTVANPRVMHHSMCTVHGANICMWLKRDLRFDPATEKFVNDDEANRLLSRAMREPYTY